MYMTNRSQMSLNLYLVSQEKPQLFALRKIAAFNFIYTLVSTNINQSAPNVVKISMTIRSCMTSIKGQIGPYWSAVCALELEKMLF